MVTFCRGHCQTLCCLPGIISLIIMCVGIISHNYFYVGGRALHGPRLELNLEPTEHSARHALLHVAPKWSSHWTTRAGLSLSDIIDTFVLLMPVANYVNLSLTALMLLAGRQEERLACKNFSDCKNGVMRCWRCYLSGFAYGPADATATRSSLALLNPAWLNLSSAGLPRSVCLPACLPACLSV